MAEHDFNTLMAALDPPLIVVTVADERERAGCLVEFHVQSSIEPQRYRVLLSKNLPGQVGCRRTLAPHLMHIIASLCCI